MPDRTVEVHQRSLAQFESAFQNEYAAYKQAQAEDDVAEMARAAQSMASLRACLRELNSMASEVYSQQQHAAMTQTNRWGLTKDEETVARNSFSNDRLTDDQKDELYYRNRERYRYMRQTGEYRDDQGRVTK